jgi:dienelactone hydrolase
MKGNVLFAYGFITLLVFGFNTFVCGQQVVRATETSVIGYLEYLPEGYDLNSDKYPIVIFLHGIGERGTNTTDLTLLAQSVPKVAALGPPRSVKAGTTFPFILISPQLKSNHTHWPTEYVMEVINHVKTYLRIDETRIYLTGLSLGGGGAWWTAQDYPELFAALAPVCGGSNIPSKACGIAAENLPVWAFHGDMDTIVPVSRSVTMVNAINDCTPAPLPQAKMTIYSGIGHNAWTNAYKTDNSVHDPNVYDWMLSFTNTVNKKNKLPVAQAGSDQVLSLNRAYIAGSGMDNDGFIAKYLWRQLSGPSPANLLNSAASKLHARDLQNGKYVFSLQVTDNSGSTDTDYVQITVENNRGPIAKTALDEFIVTTTTPFIALPASDGSTQPVEAKAKPILSKLTSIDLEGCLVTIFDEAGGRLFSGIWSAETYRNIFTRNGLYLYQIVKQGRRIDSGKIYVRR